MLTFVSENDLIALMLDLDYLETHARRVGMTHVRGP